MVFLNFGNIHSFLNKNRAKGFTHAEILIAMGIVGIIAALTIPTLIINTQTKTNISKLKKNIATIRLASKLSSIEDNLNWACSGNKLFANGTTLPCRQALFENNLDGFSVQTYAESEIQSKYQNVAFNNSHSIKDYKRIYYFPDNTVWFTNVDKNSVSCTANNFTESSIQDLILECGAFIDINGLNEPNKVSKCSTGEKKYIQGGQSEDIKGSYTASNFHVLSDCIVKHKDIGDVFPVIFVDNTVLPYDSAVEYILTMPK